MFISNTEFFIEDIELPQDVLAITRVNPNSYVRQYILACKNDREISIGKLSSEHGTWEMTVTFDDKIEEEPICLSTQDLYQILPKKVQEIASR